MPRVSLHCRTAAPPMRPPSLRMALAGALLLILPTQPAAHEIPADITVRAFLKPEPGRLRLLVRVPLSAMRDVDVPTRGSGFVDLARAAVPLRDATTLWLVQSIDLFEEGARLPAPQIVAVRVSLPSDPSFRTYDEALAHVTGPACRRTPICTGSRGCSTCSSSTRSSRIDRASRLRPGCRGWACAWSPSCGSCRRAARCAPSSSRAIPGWCASTRAGTRRRCGSSRSGFSHILDGTDHLLFLLCLVIPFRRLRPLVLVVTSFTVAHSVTLIASAYDLAPDALWFPPLVETLIAASIVYMALENIVGGRTLAAAVDDRLRRSAWCTGSASRSRCARRCSSPGRTC